MGEPLRRPLFPASRRRAALLASTSLVATFAAIAQAPAQQVLPTHGSVGSGAATISQSGSAMTINQTSSRAVINWNSFSIGAGDSVTFVQPNAGAAALNRVTGSTPSSIAGRLDANGQVFLVNPNGIAITRSGTVNVGGGFVASTLAITDKDFNQGRLTFDGGGASAAVSNAGTITAAPGGFVSLLGGSVSNSGVINAPLGKVALGSAEQATLDLSGDGFLQVALPTDAKTADGKALVDVSGTVKAAGGTVAIKAATAASAVRNAINLSGYVSARSARQVGGSIVLGGGEGGDVKVSGRLDASGRKGGGSIAASGRNVALNNARLTARGAAGKGGAVAVTAHDSVKLARTKIDASGAQGGGSIAIGGSPRGLGPLQNAATTSIGRGSLLRADALHEGDGGSITVWSTGATTVAARLSARGGALSGDGGAIETSGATLDVNSVHVDTSAAHGLTGSWLLDPTDFIISASGGDITGAALSTQLASTNVTILSNQGASNGPGDISVNDAVSWSSPNTLTLDAFHNINVNANVAIQGTGAIAFIYGDTAQTGVGSDLNGNLEFGAIGSGSASLSFTGAGGALSQNGVNYTLLRTEADLQLMAGNPGGAFALVNDIALGNAYSGNVIPEFFGHFEGLGHTLSDLSISQGGTAANVGFFGILDAAGSGTPANPPAGSLGKVTNLYMPNANVAGGSATGVGAVAGQSFGFVFNNFVSGTVTGSGANIGGVVGANFGLVSATSSSVVVNATPGSSSNVGGLVGLNNGGVINGSPSDLAQGGLASGDVQGGTAVGGVVGLNNGYVNAGSSGFIVGDAAVGGVVGQNNQGDTSFTFLGQTWGANGSVFGGYGFGGVFGTTTAGGVVGVNNGQVDLSFFNGPVSGDTSIGGLVGQNNGAISTSYAIGPVSGTTNVGGLVGFNNGGIDSSFAMGAVRGTTNVGGLVGLEGTPSSTTSVTNSYSTGAVSGTTGVGGLIGANNGGDDTLTNAYWDTTTSGQTTSAGGVGHTTAQLQGGAALPLSASFAGGATGGETNVYPYLIGFFPRGVRAISGFAFKDPAGTIPLASGAAGAAIVSGDFSDPVSGAHSIKNPSTTGVNGYYYLFADPVFLPSGANVLVYTTALAATGSTNAATYIATAGANNTTGVNILGSTLTETTALPTQSQLVGAVNAATAGDAIAPGAIGGVSFINITGTGAGFAIDQAINTTAQLTVTGGTATGTTLTADVVATGGINFNSNVALGATVNVSSGSATTTFAGTVDGTGAPGAGLTGAGPIVLNGNVTTGNGALFFNGAVTVNQSLTINAGTASVQFNSLIDSGAVSGFSLNNNLAVAGGALSFGGAIGGNFALGAVSLTSVAGMTLPSVNAATLFARTTGAASDLTLGAGTALTASGAGTAVTLAAGRDFINNAGPGAIALTDPTAPNWLIYSTNPANDVFGGLNSNNRAIWNTPFTGAAGPTNGDFYVFAFQPTVTFTSTNDAKTYGQDVTARVAGDFTVSGIQPGVAGAFLPDTAAVVFSGAPSVTSAGSPTSATVAGGPYAVNVAQGALAALNGYAFAFVSSGLLTVDREAITVSASPNTKTYDSTTSAAALPTVTTGALFDAATLAESYASPNAGSGLLLNPTITFANAAAASNYVVTLASAPVGAIDRAAITIAASANTKTYDSTTSAAALPTITAGTLFDAVTLTETYATSNAGTGLTLTPQIAFANATAAGNYSVTLTPALTGTINPEPITITAAPSTKIFDGGTSSATPPQLTAGTLFDPATLAEVFASPGPGNAISLIPSISFANPNAANNYLITLVPTGATPPNTGVILPLPILQVNLSPSVFVNRDGEIGIPGGASTCGVDLQLPDAATFSDPAAAILAISAATSQYVERCRDASQEDIANALDRYADALEIIIQKLPPKLRAQLRHIPALVRAAAVRARAAPTRAAAVRVLKQTVAQVHREIMLVRAEDPDSQRIRNAVNTGVSGVLNSAAVALARAEGI